MAKSTFFPSSQSFLRIDFTENFESDRVLYTFQHSVHYYIITKFQYMMVSRNLLIEFLRFSTLSYIQLVCNHALIKLTTFKSFALTLRPAVHVYTFYASVFTF